MESSFLSERLILMKSYSLFASVSQGIEELLKKELIDLGAQECQIVQGGVHYEADEETLYRTLLWSRLASRIFLSISHFNIHSDLYSCIHHICWTNYFDVDKTFAIRFLGTNAEIRDTQYGALRVKDAIVDHFMRQCNQRPNVDKTNPDIRIQVRLAKELVSVWLDLSGESLNQRGYRLNTGAAPIKENLAVAILKRAQWQTHSTLMDPMCGSGTLLIEGALMAQNKAPGLLRSYFGFLAWKGFNVDCWQQLCEEARSQMCAVAVKLIGYDLDPKVIQIAKDNAKRAGVLDAIHFEVRDISQLTAPKEIAAGTLVCNPPYGERLSSEPALIALYAILGQRLKQFFQGWQVSIFSGSESLLNSLKMRSDRQFKAKNGPLDCLQRNYKIHVKSEGDQADLKDEKSAADSVIMNHEALDFINRVKKNNAKLEKWAQKEGLDCYRLYNADLPEYNVAIDKYRDRFVIQEYQAPKSISPEKAQKHLYAVISAMMAHFQLRADQLILKTRAKQKGKNQYQKYAKQNDFFWVREYQCQFLVNLTDYLDTGLFLDHRLARKWIGEISKGADFLNLFAYTGTASVYAGLGGAKSTTTVDLSQTYLAWAERNFNQNGLIGKQHRLIQADCLYYLKNVNEQFDLIFIDPPTFSNSKRMQETFDVQRDYLELMRDLKRILRPNGTILFSNNRRGFKLDEMALSQLGLKAQNITSKTISMDFKRKNNIHNAYLIRAIEA